MHTLKLTLVAFAAAFVSSTTVTTPVSAHSTNACVIDVYDFCGSDHDCRISGALACQNHHSGGTPPPAPDPTYSAPNGGQSFGNSTLKLKAQ
jgi:hypothetical protein